MRQTNATRDTALGKALGEAVAGAAKTPYTEARLWVDTEEEMIDACAVMNAIAKDARTRVTMVPHPARACISYELENGSAVFVGMKRWQHLTKFHDLLRAWAAP